MMGDLISLDDDGENMSMPCSVVSPKSANPTTTMRLPQRDSFSDLTNLMRAKKSYTPIPPPTPKPQLSLLTNGMQFARGRVPSSNVLSPLAKPFHAPGSVAAFLYEQEHEPPTSVASCAIDSTTLDHRLDTLKAEFHQIILDDTEMDASQLRALDSNRPLRFGPLDPPTPTESVPPPLSAYQKRQLDEQIGRLRYQCEANKDQKSAMGRSMNMMEEDIKNLKVDNANLTEKLSDAKKELQKLGGAKGELEYLREVLQSIEAAHERALVDLIANKNNELGSCKDSIRNLEEKINAIVLERDAALKAELNTRDHADEAHQFSDALSKKEKMITELRQKYAEEQVINNNLRDEIERLMIQVDQENIDNLRKKLAEKSSLCDRQRNNLKFAEKQLKDSQARVLKAANDGESLLGAAHLVKPNANGKLPKTIISCSECYANNLPCDNDARCRSCTERNAQCARWRCSLKHKLGDCPLAPCKLPHDAQGWLVLHEPRPQW